MLIAGKPWQFDNLGCYGTEIGENCHLLDDHHRLKIMMTISVFWSLPKTTLSLNITPFQHASYWDTRHVPGIPCPINWWKWQLPRQSSPIVRLNFAKVYFLCRALYILQLCWQWWQIKTNSNDFARCPASSASNPCGASGGRRKVYFGRFTSSAWWDFDNNKCGEIFFFMLIMIIVIIMMKYHEMRSYCTITKQPEI